MSLRVCLKFAEPNPRSSSARQLRPQGAYQHQRKPLRFLSSAYLKAHHRMQSSGIAAETKLASKFPVQSLWDPYLSYNLRCAPTVGYDIRDLPCNSLVDGPSGLRLHSFE